MNPPLAVELSKSCSSRSAFVPVMQPAHFGERDDPAGLRRLYTARIWRILLQCEVGASSMIVADERLKVPGQTGLVENNEVIQTFPTNGPDHPFDTGSLPRRAGRRKHL